MNDNPSQETQEETHVPHTTNHTHGRITPWPKNSAAGNQYQSRDPRVKAPLLAAFLSLVPGLGQIYVGYYQRGFIHTLVVGSVISILFTFSNGEDQSGNGLMPLCIIFLIFFWLYNVIDGWRRAVMYNLALDGVENIQLPDDMSAPLMGGSMFGGVVLLFFGFVCLMYTKFNMPIEVIQEWWPVVPMAFGGYLLFRAIDDRKKAGKA